MESTVKAIAPVTNHNNNTTTVVCATAEQKELVIKEAARQILGYDTTLQGSERTPTKPLLSITNEDVRVGETRPFYAAKVLSDKNRTQLDLGLSTKTSLGFTIPPILALPPIPLVALANSNACVEKEVVVTTFTCIVRSYMRTEFNLIANPNTYNMPTGGDIVTAGGIYAGYELQFSIQITTRNKGLAVGLDTNIALPDFVAKLAALGIKGNVDVTSESEKIEIETQIAGQGGFLPENPPINLTYDRIQGYVDQVNVQFRETYPTLSNRVPYITTTTPVLPMIVQQPQQLPQQLPDITPKTQEKALEQLARGIVAFFAESDFKKILYANSRTSKDDALESFIETMLKFVNTHFGACLEEPEKLPTVRTMVVGDTGTGKSALVGYFNGAEIRMTKRPRRVEYLEANSNFTEIGHNLSKTKAAKIFEHYIDTGGFGDTVGLTDKVGNAIGLKLVTDNFLPNRLIVVISPAVFEKRGGPLTKLIRKLMSCFPNLADSTEWTAVRFVVNDRDGFHTKENITDKIDDAILARENDNFSIANKPLYQNRSLEEIILESNLSRAEEKQLEKNDDVIKILKSIKESFILADFSNDNTRNSIYNFEYSENLMTQANPLIPSSADFTPENLMPDSLAIFNTFLIAVTTYFNAKFTEKRKLDGEVVEGEGLADKSTKLLTKIKEKDYWSSDVNPTFFKYLTPHTPIKPRSPFAIRWPTTYKFECNIGVPIDGISLIVPGKEARTRTPKREAIGRYLDEETDLPNGKYKVSFEPAWYGYKDDNRARVGVNVLTKDHPYVVALISTLGKEIQTLQEEIQDAEEERALSPEEVAKKRKKDLDTKTQKKKELAADLAKHKDLCKVLSSVTKRLMKDATENEEEKKAFMDFCNNVDNFLLSSTSS